MAWLNNMNMVSNDSEHVPSKGGQCLFDTILIGQTTCSCTRALLVTGGKQPRPHAEGNFGVSRQYLPKHKLIPTLLFVRREAFIRETGGAMVLKNHVHDSRADAFSCSLLISGLPSTKKKNYAHTSLAAKTSVFGSEMRLSLDGRWNMCFVVGNC